MHCMGSGFADALLCTTRHKFIKADEKRYREADMPEDIAGMRRCRAQIGLLPWCDLLPELALTIMRLVRQLSKTCPWVPDYATLLPKEGG